MGGYYHVGAPAAQRCYPFALALQQWQKQRLIWEDRASASILTVGVIISLYSFLKIISFRRVLGV